MTFLGAAMPPSIFGYALKTSGRHRRSIGHGLLSSLRAFLETAERDKTCAAVQMRITQLGRERHSAFGRSQPCLRLETLIQSRRIVRPAKRLVRMFCHHVPQNRAGVLLTPKHRQSGSKTVMKMEVIRRGGVQLPVDRHRILVLTYGLIG